MDTLIQQLCDYEPALVKIIFDFVFVPCSEDVFRLCLNLREASIPSHL